MLLRSLTTEFNVHKHLHFLPIAPYSTEASLISQATPFADEACDTNRSLERTERLDLKRFFHTLHSHLVLCFNISPPCVQAMGIYQALALFGDTKQDMDE